MFICYAVMGPISIESEATHPPQPHTEQQADDFGMRISGVSGESAARAFDKLSVFNLSDPDPHPLIEFWFYNHPSIRKRMDFVRTWRP